MFNHFIFVLIFYNMNSIPKLIHQIWIGPKKIPNYWSNTFSELYIENNNDYEYKIWTNNNYLNELNKYPVLKIIFDEFKQFCYKADILRLIILYEYGGIYIDADSVWLYNKSFNELLEKSKDTNFFVGRSPNENENSKFFLTNGVFGCTKNHPYIKNMIDYLENSIYKNNKYTKKLVNRLESSKICGPGLFTRELKNKDVTIFPSNYFYPISWFNLNIDNIDYNSHENSYMFQYGGTTNNLQSLTDINFYWINMDRSIERRKHMYYLFSKNLIYNYRINAYDGNKINEYNDLNYNSFNNISKYEYCCTFSHLKAIKTSYENNDKISIICEDDLCIDYKKKWKYNLEDIIKNAPNDWEIIKIHCNNEKHINKLINDGLLFEPWNIRSTSTLGYIININGMKKILNKYFINDKFVLKDSIEDKADYLLYTSCITYDYRYPLFNHLCNISNINKDQEITHINGKDAIDNYFLSINDN